MSRRRRSVLRTVAVPAAASAAAALGAFARAATPGRAASALDGHPLAQALVLLGCVFLLAAAVGLVRFPDVYTRLHAATKLVTLGGLGIFAGAAIAFFPVDGTPRVLLIAAFFFLTAPLSGYMIARSAYLRGLPWYQEAGSVDDWRALGSEAQVSAEER
ncbi:MAG: monovalent cation/H(+) antiporter subunit G [Deinococcales bacterium]